MPISDVGTEDRAAESKQSYEIPENAEIVTSYALFMISFTRET